jgi:beta-lactamase regulating signal transducer with metallopeptidase domain
MAEWASQAMDVLWRNGVAAVPIVVLTALACKVLPCRPATRHTMWLVVLGWLFVPAVLPEPPTQQLAGVVRDLPGMWAQVVDPKAASRNAPPVSLDVLRDALTPLADTIRRAHEAPPGKLTENTELPRPTVHASKDPVGEEMDTSTPPSPRSVVRPAKRSPEMLAQADDAGGPLSAAPPERSPAPILDRHDWANVDQAIDIEVDFAEAEQPWPIEGIAGRWEQRNGQAEEQAAVSARTFDNWRTWAAGLIDVRNAVANIPPLPTEVWVGGTGFLLLLSLIKVSVFRGRLRTALPAPQSVVRVVEAASLELGLRQAPRAWMVDGRFSPMIWCGIRPKLILPTLLWSQLDGAGRRAVVFHELAHVRRRDHWICWADTLVGSLYWWHPLVWWVRRRLHAEAEVCCDAWVTTLMPRTRRAYAEALLVTRQYLDEVNQPVPAMGIGVTTGRARRFARRLKMVMTESIKPRLSVSGMMLVLTMATMGWLTTPARSCPEEEKAAAAVKASGKDCGKGCGKECEKGCAKGCGKATAGGASATACGTPAPCAGSAATPAVTPAPVAEATNTYEQHMAARHALATSLAPVISAKVVPLLSLASDDEKNPEDRISRLEREVERTNERLERLIETMEGRHDLHETPGAEPRTPRPPGAPRAPRAAAPPQPPAPPGAPQPLLAPMPGGDFGPDGGEVSPRVYKLSKGKLEALTALMSRPDVPILIRPAGDGIEVHATPRGHRVFAAFVRLIEPGSDAVGVLEQREQGPVARGIRQEMRKQAKEMEQAAKRRAKAMEKLEKRRSKTGARMEQIRQEATAKAEMSEQLEREAESVAEQAETISEQAEEIREQTQDLEREAGRVEERDRRVEIQRHVLALRHEAEKLDQRREHLQDQARAIEDRARQAEDEARDSENELEQLEEELERLEEEASENGDEDESHVSADDLDAAVMEALDASADEDSSADDDDDENGD